jgi:acyl carrier protein phosphodiesterase
VNFLAHLYLSPATPEGWLGGLLGDFVKGPVDAAGYPAAVADAIRLHRAVDSFTDGHAHVLEAKARFAQGTRRYAGVVLDIAFDHFLARDWHRHHDVPLERFARDVYAALGSAPHALPERFARMLPWMVSQDWLVSYREPAGAIAALERMSRRLSDGSGLEAAAAELRSRYGEMESDFQRFFPALLRAFPAAGRAPIA